MPLDDLAAKIYVLENENERLKEKLAGAESALTDVGTEEFRFAHKTPLWMEGFVCAKVACAAALRGYIEQN